MAKFIYISGKMGEKKLSSQTIEKFQKAQERLMNDGWTVINPASPDFQRDAGEEVKIEARKWNRLKIGAFDEYGWLLLHDLHMMAVCEAIYMLKDWKGSPGATAEYYFAKACNKVILLEDEDGSERM